MLQSHLKALLRKNYLIWKRNWCCSLFEILVPVIFSLLLALLRKESTVSTIPQQSFLTNITYFSTNSTGVGWYDFKNCSGNGGGSIALSPQNNTIMNNIFTLLNTSFENSTYIWFNSNDELDSYVTSSEYGSYNHTQRICFGVVLEQPEDHVYNYSLRYNLSGPTPDLPFTIYDNVNSLQQVALDNLQKFVSSGYLQIETWLDNLILQTELNETNATIQTAITSVMVPSYHDDPLTINLQGTLVFLTAYPLLFPYLRMSNNLILEKEKKIKEGMKMMGLTRAAFYLSWIITYSIIYAVIALLYIVILNGLVFTNSNFFLLFIWYYLFCFCLIGVSMFVSVFFSKAKTGLIAALVLFLLLQFASNALNSNGISQATYNIASLSPVIAMALGGNQMLTFESNGQGITSATVSLTYNNYAFSSSLLMLSLDIVIFMLLALYFDQVLPGDYGLKKHPFFCFICKKRKPVDNDSPLIDADGEDPNDKNENVEKVDEVLKQQDITGQSLKIRHLRKVYDSKKVAVDDVSMSMYSGQIFVLLGHNGAGKTTTISMLTGLLPTTSGTATVFGLNVQTQIEEIRKIMGVCPQHDILFDDLTVKEHLELFAIFKGMNSKDIPEEVEKMVKATELEEKRDYLAKNLSGGQKRRLSVGIAFIGGSKLIILDEPSSGMDTSARRALWDMLKNDKMDKIILLTTHYMDEADYLGDRIAIMGQGRLQCLGRPLFLKNKFGVGYNLTIVKNDVSTPTKPITALTSSIIPTSKAIRDVATDLHIQLPLDTAPYFQKLFDTFDEQKEFLGISSYGVSVTTLEEVFINVANIEIDPDVEMRKSRISNLRQSLITSKKLEEESEFSAENLSSLQTFWTHFQALVIKRFQYFKRDRRGLCCEILLPVFIIIIGLLLQKIQVNLQNPPVPITPTMFDTPTADFLINSITPSGAVVPTSLLTFNSSYNAETDQASNISAFNTDVFNRRGEVDTRYFDIYLVDADTAAQNYSYVAFVNTTALESPALAFNTINNRILQVATNNPNAIIINTILPLKVTQNEGTIDGAISGISGAFVFSLGISFIPASLIVFVVKEREWNVKHQQMVSGVSLAAYWFSNYFVDIVKHIIPAAACCVMVQVFAISAYQGDTYGIVWLLFILYGFCIAPWTYALSFFFKDPGSAQLINFFSNFACGFILSLVTFVLRLIPSTNATALVLQYFFRIIPTFAFSYGLLNMSSRSLYAVLQGLKTPQSSWDWDIAGADVAYLGFMSVVYFILVFVLEWVQTKQGILSIFTREDTVKSAPIVYDDDVEAEATRVEKIADDEGTVKVNKLRKVFVLGKGNNKVAVDQVSFAIGNGECFGLLGVNGAGKTTTFKMLSGEIAPTSGRVVIKGYDLATNLPEARRFIGYCPQFDALLDNLSAKEHLNLYAALKGIPLNKRPAIVERALIDLKLKQYENIPAGTYSGGNKRKLSVAIAMVGNPPIVFLDEPSCGMDPEAREFMWQVISRISTQRKQSSVILTTHSMEEAEALSTRMGIMVEGNLRCLGSTQHIKSKFGGGYEIEIKLEDQRGKVAQVVSNLKYANGAIIGQQDVENVFRKLGALELAKMIVPGGVGADLYTEISKNKQIKIEFLVDFFLKETTGNRMIHFLIQNFGHVSIIEHFSSFYRFKAQPNVSIGKMFGLLEKNKNDLEIVHYSIKQTTIEQIFNMFARNLIRAEDYRTDIQPAQIKLDVKTEGTTEETLIYRQPGLGNSLNLDIDRPLLGNK